MNPGNPVESVNTACASHCGGTCLLKLYVERGTITRIETDDGGEPQLRGCLRGRGYRQRVYAPDRLLYPMKRVGERGEGKLERVSWDEAVDLIAREIVRVRDTYGPASMTYITKGGDLGMLNTLHPMRRVLSLAGGFTQPWGVASFQAGVYAQWLSYGTYATSNDRDDLLNAKLILMWGWNPVSTITGTNTNWFLARAKESGTRIISIDPKYTDSGAAFASEWVPIRPGTDAAMLLAMAHVMITEGLQDQKFLDDHTVGYEPFRSYVTGEEDGVPKTPEWAEDITSVTAATIRVLARAYATTRPAALIAGIGPGRTAYGEQYHRIAIALAAMTGNIGIHGGDAAGRSWESVLGGFPYKLAWQSASTTKATRVFGSTPVANPVDANAPPAPPGAPWGYLRSRVHEFDIPDFIEHGKAGGYPADCRLIAIVNCSYVNSGLNINRIIRALKSGKVEFVFVQEQFLTPTTWYADVVLPVNTYMERTDMAIGVGHGYYGCQNKAIESLGEAKSHMEIANLLAERLGLSPEKLPEDRLSEMVANSEISDYEEFKKKAVFRFNLPEPYIAFEKQIRDPVNNPFPTPSGKIEIYSQRLADLKRPDLPAVPRYIETWESRNDPLARQYPLQMISTHFKTRANNTFHNMPWLKEIALQALHINPIDAVARGVHDCDMVRVFNDRGATILPARVTETIMPGVVDLPEGAWYRPDESGVDRGGCPNVLTRDKPSPGGAWATNTCLVQVERA